MAKKKDPRGGAREGAGRPKLGKRVKKGPVTIWLDAAERAHLKGLAGSGKNATVQAGLRLLLARSIEAAAEE